MNFSLKQFRNGKPRSKGTSTMNLSSGLDRRTVSRYSLKLLATAAALLKSLTEHPRRHSRSQMFDQSLFLVAVYFLGCLPLIARHPTQNLNYRSDLISQATSSSAQQDALQNATEWTWHDRSGVVRKDAELNQILADHSLWLESKGKAGKCANLSDAHLEGARLHGVDLSGTDLSGATLTGAHLNNARLKGAHLFRAHLNSVELFDAEMSDADLNDVDLAEAHLGGANLSSARLIGADLSHASLKRTNLSGADLSLANLKDTALFYTNLKDVSMNGARLAGAIFEPSNNPDARQIAKAQNIELLTYRNFSDALLQLRKQFQDGGFREQERKVNFAIFHRQVQLSGERCNSRTVLHDCGDYIFNVLLFDWTCKYGMKPGRPLVIVATLWGLLTFIYLLFMHLPGSSGIYLIGKVYSHGRERIQGLRIKMQWTGGRKHFLLLCLWREWRLFRLAMFFSLMSAFNIGFRDINFGRWLRMLTKREYDLKAAGWARTLAGFHSLFSVYLFALWVLTYFGRPFQ